MYYCATWMLLNTKEKAFRETKLPMLKTHFPGDFHISTLTITLHRLFGSHQSQNRTEYYLRLFFSYSQCPARIQRSAQAPGTALAELLHLLVSAPRLMPHPCPIMGLFRATPHHWKARGAAALSAAALHPNTSPHCPAPNLTLPW